MRLGDNAAVHMKIAIGTGCGASANSVVTRDIPDYTIVGGVPARALKRFDFDLNEWVRI